MDAFHQLILWCLLMGMPKVGLAAPEEFVRVTLHWPFCPFWS